MKSLDPEEIARQVRAATDPDGRLAALGALGQSPSGAAWLSPSDLRRLQQSSSELSRLQVGIAEALHVLVPRGWAVFNMQSEAVREAVAMTKRGEGEAADALLAKQWDGLRNAENENAWRTLRVCSRVTGLGRLDPVAAAHYQNRGRLLREAREAHAAGRFASSILLVQAQIEGIVADVSEGLLFFTGRPARQARLVSDSGLMAIEAGLEALRRVVTGAIDETQARGDISRHGAAHGRDVAFDTKENSAKYWSILDAVVDWAAPRARAIAEQRRSEREAEFAGVDGVGDDGRRLDAREFEETRDALQSISIAAMGRRRREAGFRDDIVGAVFTERDFIKWGLSADRAIQTMLSDDEQCVAYWRSTPSGWVLGVALAFGGHHFTEWRYSGPTPPGDLPEPHGDFSAWRGDRDYPVDWS